MKVFMIKNQNGKFSLGGDMPYWTKGARGGKCYTSAAGLRFVIQRNLARYSPLDTLGHRYSYYNCTVVEMTDGKVTETPILEWVNQKSST